MGNLFSSNNFVGILLQTSSTWNLPLCKKKKISRKMKNSFEGHENDPSTHTTSFWRLYNVHNVKKTSCGRQNNVVCVLGKFARQNERFLSLYMNAYSASSSILMNMLSKWGSCFSNKTPTKMLLELAAISGLHHRTPYGRIERGTLQSSA